VIYNIGTQRAPVLNRIKCRFSSLIPTGVVADSRHLVCILQSSSKISSGLLRVRLSVADPSSSRSRLMLTLPSPSDASSGLTDVVDLSLSWLSLVHSTYRSRLLTSWNLSSACKLFLVFPTSPVSPPLYAATIAVSSSEVNASSSWYDDQVLFCCRTERVAGKKLLGVTDAPPRVRDGMAICGTEEWGVGVGVGVIGIMRKAFSAAI
jgi:hypothetical protein